VNKVTAAQNSLTQKIIQTWQCCNTQ